MGLVGVVLEALARRLRIETQQVDVYHLGPGFTTAIEREDLSVEAEEEMRRAEDAEVLIAATPVFRGSYTAMFKHFFDLIDQYALANKPVVLAATAGSEDRKSVVEDKWARLGGRAARHENR